MTGALLDQLRNQATGVPQVVWIGLGASLLIAFLADLVFTRVAATRHRALGTKYDKLERRLNSLEIQREREMLLRSRTPRDTAAEPPRSVRSV